MSETKHTPGPYEALVDAVGELLECAELRGYDQLPCPEDDLLLWTARMQEAWDTTHAAYSHAAKHDAAQPRMADTALRLLDACKMAASMINDELEQFENQARADGVWRMMADAIARAEGSPE